MSNFVELAELDVNEHTEKKGNFTYLSWAWAHDYMAKLDPGFNWWLHDFADANGVLTPFMATISGVFVRVSVTFKGKTMTHTYPVLDYKNKPITATDATSFDINTAQMRCFAKCCALHGLGLYIFAGEDLPKPPENPLKDVPAEQVIITHGNYKDAGLTLGDLAQGRVGYAGKGMIKYWASGNHQDPVFVEKAAEVYSKHINELDSNEVSDLLQDCDNADELLGVWRLLTKDQQEEFKEVKDNRKTEIKEAA